LDDRIDIGFWKDSLSTRTFDIKAENP
jgi:hypothetical protein